MPEVLESPEQAPSMSSSGELSLSRWWGAGRPSASALALEFEAAREREAKILRRVEQRMRRNARLQRVFAAVSRHFDETITLDDAAEIACLSRTYFSAYFRRHTGIGFHYWIEGLRISWAARQLRTTEHSINQVAFRAGFRDVRTFQRAFKRHTGKCPSFLME
ncbi:MAG: AraC family transcriptional regulator [Thermoanaerobaculia bacterium]|nr:AraC family transcriptional regulator [Thermoanaerobaculia bacterium]